MEESSDAHMETDVSSTTEDVPETQEVTGSNGNMEMVLIVEKIDEDPVSTNFISSHAPPKVEENATNQAAELIQKDSEPHHTEKSPHKDSDLAKLMKSPNVQVNKNLIHEVLPHSSHSEEIVHSSSKDDTHMSLNTNGNIAQISPIKDAQKTPPKNLSNEQEGFLVNNKLSPKEHPNNEKATPELPTKEQSDTQQKFSPQYTPIKKQLDVHKFSQKTPTISPIKGQTDVQKTAQKLNTREQSYVQRITKQSPIKEQLEMEKISQQITINDLDSDVHTIRRNSLGREQSNIQETAQTPTKVQSDEKSLKQTLSNELSPVKKPLNSEQSDTQKTTIKTPLKILVNSIVPTETLSDEQSNEMTDQKSLVINLENKTQQKIVTTDNSVEISVTPKELVSEQTYDTENKIQSVAKHDSDDTVQIATEKEVSNEYQLEANSDTSEKELNKSISRELKSLINSAKESKIINECTQLTSKTRKSRINLDLSNPINTSAETSKSRSRRNSDISQKSNSSGKSDKTAVKRSMRSQNPEFVNKVKLFLNSVTKPHKYINDCTDDDDEIELEKSKDRHNVIRASTPKKKKITEVEPEEQPQVKNTKLKSDLYCWRCHWSVEQAPSEKTPPLHCTVCPRSFHFKCLSGAERAKINAEKNWVCPECMAVLHAESSETRSQAMKKTSLGMLCDLLKYALERMMDLNGVEPFMQPVDRTAFPDYDKYAVHPMDLSLMKAHIDAGLYGSTEAFAADAQWILHNSIIFNTLQSKLTGAARALVRSCRAEMGEIEACPECYAAAHARRPTWFTDVCTTPHILLWAKLKGFPYWPAKGMSVSSAGLVDVRFFGAHDRAWVPAKDCFLFSEKDPNNFRTKRQDILDSMKEAEQHIRNISRKYGKFVYPPFKTQFDPNKLTEQLKMMIPSFEGEIRTPAKDKSSNSSPSAVKSKSRSNSKSSKSSLNDGDTSEGEDASTAPARKMADGAEIARVDDDSIVDKDKTIEIEMEIETKENETSRKRRRSDLEEAVITLIETSGRSKEKKKRVDNEKKDHKNDAQTPSSSENVSMKSIETKKSTEKTDTNVQTANEAKNSSASVQKPLLQQKIKPLKIKTIHVKGASTPVKKHVVVTSTPKDKDPSPKVKHKKSLKVHKSTSSEKNKNNEDDKSKRRRSSKNKSFNISSDVSLVNINEIAEKKDKSSDSSIILKEKVKENLVSDKNKGGESSKNADKGTPSGKNQEVAKGSRDRVQFDDDTSLAIIARESSKDDNVLTGLPTISSVRSLSKTAQNTSTTTTKTTSSNKTIEVTIEANSDCSIFTPTSTDNVKNMKEVVTKLQKLRNDTEKPMVGRVGVRAFARMTSPPAERNKDKDVEVEIKAEPIDIDDPDRQIEKLDLMNAFQLRPVNQTTSSLRDVRINKVTVSPSNVKKVTEPKPRAKKTFPQPRKTDEGRSELNGKNSMVYIPIQPPSTPTPMRLPRPTMPAPRLNAPINTSVANSIVNTITPLLPVSMQSTISSLSPTMIPSSSTQVQMPTVGQVPTTVHTVPLITSVNGQWTFSLQPVMSVGGIDRPSSPPINGVPERSLMPIAGVGTTSSLASPVMPALPPALMPGAARLDGPGEVNLLSPSLPLATPTMVAVPLNALTNPSVPPLRMSTATVNRIGNDVGEPPRLQQRPALAHPLDSNTPIGSLPAPSSAGPLTAKLNQNAAKMMDFFRSLLEDSLEKLDEPVTQVTNLKLQLEQLRWRHQHELDEIKHNHELTLTEMRASFEKEKKRIVADARRSAQVETEAAVKVAKSKQWCANCKREAQFYCCWNTSYCDYPCQRAHWSRHFAVCTQQRNQDGNSDKIPPPESRLQPQPENLPKSSPAPTLSVGGSVSTTRMVQDGSQKSSIIMSVVEDTSGNQSLKCVGTYKAPTTVSAPTQVPPAVVSKPIVASDENAANKKVVTSGGYLIVGGGGANTLVTPSRRAHTIQYLS